MNILAFTTSTDFGSAAVARDGKLLAQVKWQRNLKSQNIKQNTKQNTKSNALILKINQLLKKAKLKPQELQGLVVDKGPGSFTGCRVAANVAKTFAYTLDIPVMALSSLEIIARGIVAKDHGPNTLCVLDAHKSLVYAQWFEFNGEQPAPRSPLAAKALSELLPAIQSGTRIYGLSPQPFAKAFEEKEAIVIAAYPKAATMALLREFSFQTWKDIEPSYIRAPEAYEKLAVERLPTK